MPSQPPQTHHYFATNKVWNNGSMIETTVHAYRVTSDADIVQFVSSGNMHDPNAHPRNSTRIFPQGRIYSGKEMEFGYTGGGPNALANAIQNDFFSPAREADTLRRLFAEVVSLARGTVHPGMPPVTSSSPRGRYFKVSADVLCKAVGDAVRADNRLPESNIAKRYEWNFRTEGEEPRARPVPIMEVSFEQSLSAVSDLTRADARTLAAKLVQKNTDAIKWWDSNVRQP